MKAAFLFLYLIRLLPFGVLHKIADAIGILAYYAVKPRRKVGEVNLKKMLSRAERQPAHRPAQTPFPTHGQADTRIRPLLVRTCRQAALVGALSRQTPLDEALAAGEKVIILYPHFTAFEMAVYTLNQDVPLTSMYSHQKNKALDEQILKGRHRYNNVFLIGRTEGLRAIIKHLRKSDAPFLYLPDQDFGRNDSIFVNFFGIQTATITGLSRIAGMTKAKIIPAIPTREADNTVTLRFYPAWDNFPTENVEADTQRMNDFIEERVREHPEQYFWLHKRFKTRPESENSFY